MKLFIVRQLIDGDWEVVVSASQKADRDHMRSILFAGVPEEELEEDEIEE